MNIHSVGKFDGGLMIFQGRSIHCSTLDDGIAELRFDLLGESVNKFNKLTLTELAEAVALLKTQPGVKGLLVTSGKDAFIVGADVTEFLDYFKNTEDQLVEWIMEVHKTFNAVEDFDFPTVTA